MGFVSDGNYDIPRGIVCSRPVICLGDFKVKFVNDLTLNQIEKLGLQKTIKSLQNEINKVINCLNYEEEDEDEEYEEEEEEEEIE